MNYALLVGVNHYKSKRISNLNGCENDVDLWVDYLKGQFQDDIQITSLKSQEATRENIVEGFQSHLNQAKDGELAFFYFSGHGCREPSPQEFWKFQTDREHENIVCYDSLEGAEDIADKELQFLIWNIAQQGAEVVIIFDSCHSGSGTRGRQYQEGIRKDNNRLHIRPKERFLKGTFENLGQNGRHLFIAACDENQLSRERKMGFSADARWGGLFTCVLLEVLDQLQQPGLITYSNLGDACRWNLQSRMYDNAKQTPRIESIGGFDTNKFFLQTKGEKRRLDLYTLSEDEHGTWKVNLGRVHGLQAQEQASFSIFSDISMETCAGEVRTKSIGLYDSPVIFPPGFTPLQGTRFFIPATYLPMERLSIWVPKDQLNAIKQEVNALPDVRQGMALQTNNKISRQAFEAAIYLTTSQENAVYGVVSTEDHWKLVHAQTENKVYSWSEVPKGSSRYSNFHILAEALLHIAKWERMNHFDNPSSGITHEKLWQTINFVDIKEQITYERSEITLDHAPQIVQNSEGRHQYINPLRVQFNLINSATIALHCVCYYLSSEFEIIETANLELPADNRPRRLDKGHLVIRDPQVNQCSERYTLLLSEEKLPFLNLASPKRLKDIFDPPRKGEQEKDLFVLEEDHKENWYTHKLRIKLLRELADLAEEQVSLHTNLAQIDFKSPSSFKAKVSLASSAKHMEGPQTDRYLHTRISQLGLAMLDFSAKGKLETILEIHHITGAASLAQNPLKISLSALKLEPEMELWVMTLPEDLDTLSPGLTPPENETWEVGFPVLARIQASENGTYDFQLTDIPQNPHDGRYDHGNSLKLSFMQVAKGALEWVSENLVTTSEGKEFFVLREERVE